MHMSIRGNGCIYQLDKGEDGKKPRSRCRKWRLVVSVGKDPRSGKYRQKAKVFKGSYTQAKHALRDFIMAIERGEEVRKTSWTFNEYAEQYVRKRLEAGEIQERTALNLQSSLRSLGHHIGFMRLHEIGAEDIEDACRKLRAGDSISEKPLSKRTLYNIGLSAAIMFGDAKERGVISNNPLEGIPLPKKGNAEKQSLPARSYRELIRVLDPTERMQCAVLLCAALGLRRSEAIGLSWGDVSFSEKCLNLHASADDHGGLKETKTRAGCRLLPLPDFLLKALKARKEFVVRQLLANGSDKVTAVEVVDSPSGGDYVEIDDVLYDIDSQTAVTCDKGGNRLKPNSLSNWWRRNREAYGLGGFTLHGLRHSFLSLAAAQGIHPSVMMRLAGHANPGITMAIYTHVNIDQEREAMEAMQVAYMVG